MHHLCTAASKWLHRYDFLRHTAKLKQFVPSKLKMQGTADGNSGEMVLSGVGFGVIVEFNGAFCVLD
jgi:hypothetical protein